LLDSLLQEIIGLFENVLDCLQWILRLG